MSLQILIREQIFTDGKEVFDSGNRLSRSLVLQFLQFIEGAFIPSWRSIKDTGGVNRNAKGAGTSSPWIELFGSLIGPNVGVTTFGIVVGSGVAAESNSDYKLQTQIGHGVGAGQLQYQDGRGKYTAAQVVGANVDLVCYRDFINGSGGDVTVNEIACYVDSQDTVPSQKYFCLVRDVLAVSRVVANGQTYRVTYTFRTTV